MFFNIFRHRPRFSYGGSAARALLMVVLFAAVCWAFWANSQRYVTKFSAAGRFHDDVGAYTVDQKDEIIKILGRINRDVGVKVTLHAKKTLFTSPEAIDGEVLFGICPSQKQMVLFMPGIWRNALGEGFVFQLRSNIMEPAFEDGTWPEASIKALILLEERMISLAR